jgi:hypothetical protein
VTQVARVCRHFTEAGIMVHAYLMYGFPTQTAQETIDSLEMVRQLFETGVLQSAFWHLFTMTAHSPIGLEPEKFKVKKRTVGSGTFANNDVEHLDPTGADHESFGFGLRKALLNYMHGVCFDFPLQKWFDFKVPRTSVAPDYIQKAIDEPDLTRNSNAKIIWLGKQPAVTTSVKSKKGAQWEVMTMNFPTKKGAVSLQVEPAKGNWLLQLLPKISVSNMKPYTLAMVKMDYEVAGLDDFELFWDNKPMNTLYKAGLLLV